MPGRTDTRRPGQPPTPRRVRGRSGRRRPPLAVTLRHPTRTCHTRPPGPGIPAQPGDLHPVQKPRLRPQDLARTRDPLAARDPSPAASPQATASQHSLPACGARAEWSAAEQPAELRPPQQWSPGAGPPPPQPQPVSLLRLGLPLAARIYSRREDAVGKDTAQAHTSLSPAPDGTGGSGPAPRPMGRKRSGAGVAWRNKGRLGGAALAGRLQGFGTEVGLKTWPNPWPLEGPP
ncbi:hypothetical protein TREES_T100004162 [Tupaia chinensis]|uniref:Uncharacterized protein n=1 Tax=Tupaia chinensis TaxID=246437 RepID=L9KM53_TUPCH|nr:hypothetical protein TREES_T100004162 [Tupaia chinensis]